MVGENPVEPLEKLEFLRRFRPMPVIEAAARNPEPARIVGLRTALPPVRSSPASQHSGDGGLPGKKIALDLQLPDLPVQFVDHLLRIPQPPAPCCRAQTAPPLASPAPASSC
jgi:hypothetical protein